MSDEFAIPVENESEFATPAVPSPNDEFAIPGAPAAISEFAIPGVAEAIKASPKPDWTKATFEKATAINSLFDVPFPQAMATAGSLQDAKAPESKKLGQAIVDRWKSETISTQISQIGWQMMDAVNNPEKFAELQAEMEALEAVLPGLEDIKPAYPDNVWGKLAEFGRSAVTGATGLAAQQFESIAGKEIAEAAIEARKAGFMQELKFAVGQGARPITGMGQIEGGAAFLDLVKAGVDPQIAVRYAKGIGVVNGILEVAEIATFIKMFPGADVVFEGAIRSLSQKAVIGPLVKNAAVKLGAKYVSGVAQEMAQELTQEVSTFYIENMAIELNNAVKGTALETNKDFLGRAKQLVKDFLPGMMLAGMLPIGASAVKEVSNRKTVTEATAKVETPMTETEIAVPVQQARDAVQQAVEADNVEVARPVIEQAATEQATAISNADRLTPAMVNDAMELVEMQDAVEAEAGEAPTADVAPSTAASFGIKLPELTEAESAEWDQFAQELKGEVVAAPELTSEQASASVEAGRWVDDTDIGKFSTEPWARDEISNREDLRDLASYLADTGQATAFDSFVAQAKQIETTPKSDDYYRNIWDTAPRAETVVDPETMAVDEEAEIDKKVAAEEKAVKKVAKVDGWLAELDKAGPMWSPDTETVREILDAKAQTAPAAEATEDLALTEIANTTLGTKQKLVRRVIHDILKPPGAGVGMDAYDTLTALQAPYTVKETKNVAKMQKAILDYQSKHPGETLVPEAQEILSRKSIKDLTAKDLIDLWRQQKDIRERGAAQERDRRARIKTRRIQMATGFLAETPGGYLAERIPEAGSITAMEQEKKLARKGKIKFDVVHPMRLLEEMGPKFKEVFWDRRKVLEGQEITRATAHDREIRDLYAKHNIKPQELIRKAGDTGYYVDTLLYYYGQMKEPDGRRAVLYGNDENETRITRAIASLPQNYRDFIDDLQGLFNTHYAETRKVQIEVNGRAAPQVKHYLPMKREQDFGQAMVSELSTDAGVRENARVAGMQKGFTKQRVTFKEGTQQARIRTDLLNILAEQVTKESRYVAMEEWARDMAWLLGGKSKESKKFIAAVKAKHGKPAVAFLQNYVNAVVRPESFNGTDFNGVISRVFRNMNDAALMYKLSTVLVQAEGPFRALGALNFKQQQYVFAGLFKSTFQNRKAAEFMYSKSPVMKALAESEAIDPALQEGRTLRHSKTGLGATIQLARKAMKDVGYLGLSAANKWTITAEWTSVYQAELKRTGDDAAAVKLANDAVYKHQPSGNLADAPQMYWKAKKNILLSYLLRFSRATNQTAQMLFYDLPKNVKAGQIGKATGILAAFAIGATINGLRKRKRLPESPEELLEDGIAGFTDAIGSVTYGGAEALIAGATGDFRVGEIKPLESLYQAGAMIKDIATGNINNKEIWRLLSLVGQMGGLPTPAGENVFRALYDTEEEAIRFDPVELIGRRPKE